MVKFFQKLGKAIMLPVACLPIASIMMGAGYWIDPTGWGANNVIAAFLLKGGGALIDNMAILFAVGIAVGMSDDNDGTSALAGLVSWLVMTTLLAPGAVAFFQGIDISLVNPAFSKIETQFVGILAGIIGASTYNKFKNTKLPDFLAFFSGKRSVAIVSASVSTLVAVVLFFVWPVVYTSLVNFGTGVVSTGAVGVGIYGFLNRLLIPTGLHHAMNSVFWFDVAGINDLANFWSGQGVLGETGMYMTGFFPVMMFGLPGAALAMYHTAKPERKKIVGGILLAGAVSSFFTGVTEPLEFSFMFVAPWLYFTHAVLSGITNFAVALLPVRAGFNFSAGFVDFVLSSKTPMALNPILLIPIGLVVGTVYYVVFRALIVKFNINTLGREDEEVVEDSISVTDTATSMSEEFTKKGKKILEGLGGKENIVGIDNCITRLRVEVEDMDLIKEDKIREANILGIIKAGKKNIQIIIGPQVQFVADAIKKQL